MFLECKVASIAAILERLGQAFLQMSSLYLDVCDAHIDRSDAAEAYLNLLALPPVLVCSLELSSSLSEKEAGMLFSFPSLPPTRAPLLWPLPLLRALPSEFACMMSGAILQIACPSNSEDLFFIGHSVLNCSPFKHNCFVCDTAISLHGDTIVLALALHTGCVHFSVTGSIYLGKYRERASPDIGTVGITFDIENVFKKETSSSKLECSE